MDNTEVFYLFNIFEPIKIATLSFVAIAIVFIFTKIQRAKKTSQHLPNDLTIIPSLPGKQWFVGHLLHLRNKTKNAAANFTLHYFVEESIRLGRTYRFQLPLYPPTIFTSDPKVIDRFTNTGFSAGYYEKSPQLLRQYTEFLGKGIFLSNGEEWKHQRKVARPLFDKKRLESYCDLFLQNSLHLITSLQSIAEKNEEIYQQKGIDFQDYFMRFTLDSFCEIGFGVNINSIDSTDSALKFQRAFDYVQTFTENRGRQGDSWRIKEFFLPDREFYRQLNYMNEFISDIIAQRRNDSIEVLSGKKDLLSQLLIQNYSDDKLTDQELRDWVMNFLIAGRDTTAVTLTWCSYLLSKPDHAHILQRVIDEICELLAISPEEFNSQSITPHLLAQKIDFQFQKKQKYLHQVLQETLRLYPPVPVDGYAALKDDIVTTSTGEKFFVGKGYHCVYSAWVTHHNPDNYPNPEVFNPDRFSEPIIPSSFVPFHFGPRICLGQEMAYIEAKILITCLLSQLNFSLVDESVIVPKQAIILTSLNGLPMHISPR